MDGHRLGRARVFFLRALLQLVSGCECRHGKLVSAGLRVSAGRDAGLRLHSPLCRVRRPPDRTPRGRVPVGVRPFSCRTLSFSSLLNTHTHTHVILKVLKLFPGDHRRKGVAPEHREDASHLSDGPDLVSDHLLSDSGSSACETKQREQQTGQTTC